MLVAMLIILTAPDRAFSVKAASYSDIPYGSYTYQTGYDTKKVIETKPVYEAEEAGHFNKTVTVYCNVENSPLRLKVKGSVTK